MLASGNQPDQDIAHFSQQIQVRIYLPFWQNKGASREKSKPTFTEHLLCWSLYWKLYIPSSS
jgi:hypothetical protein